MRYKVYHLDQLFVALRVNDYCGYAHLGESSGIVFSLLWQYYEVGLGGYARFEVKGLGGAYVAYLADELGSSKLIYGPLVDLFLDSYQLILEAKGNAGGGRDIVTGDDALCSMLKGHFVAQLILYG